jgi:hypothetical protein
MSKRFVVLLGVLGLFLGTAHRASADIVGKDDRRPVAELEANDPLRSLSKPFGVLLYTVKNRDGKIDVWEGCTAAVISQTHVLTVPWCAGGIEIPTTARAAIRGVRGQDDGWVLERLQVRLGMEQAAGGTKTFELKLPPVQLDKKLDFAVLEVEGNPSTEFGTAQLLVRDPIPDEKLIVFQWSRGTDEWSRVTDESSKLFVQWEDCTIPRDVGPVPRFLGGPSEPLEDALVPHTCDTVDGWTVGRRHRDEVGAGGALLLSSTDRAVLGIHKGPQVRTGLHSGIEFMGYNLATSMRAIVEASPAIAAVAWIRNTPQATGSGAAKRFTVSIQDEAFSQIRTGSTIKINGKAHRVADVLKEGRRVTYFGEQSNLLRGRNEIEIERIKLHLWNAEDVLSRFEDPYKKSYAIIAAIDAYDEAVDPGVHSKFRKLDGMVARADELRNTLIALGFNNENIIWLPNGEATKKNIDDALALFWDGGRHRDADRLVFYFGGHGGGVERNGYLVTHDMEYGRPTWTGFPMSDFDGRHFRNINVHHFLVLLDSCSSGLAVQTMQTLDEELSVERLERFANLVTINKYVKERARQMLVASTGEQRALWETGGIFTHALIDGLKGRADVINDGIISLDELKLYIQDRVEPHARAVGVAQRPRLSTADNFGEGRMLFILPKR